MAGSPGRLRAIHSNDQLRGVSAGRRDRIHNLRSVRITDRWPMGRGTILRRRRRPRGEGGFSIVEVTVALFLLMTIAVFGLQTMTAAWMSENWAIMQSMTDAYAAIET